MAGKHHVVQGATLQCQFSVEPKTDVLKVESQKILTLNDKDGNKKFAATNKDIGQTLEKNSFGKCIKQPNGSGDFLPCNPNITEWIDVQEKGSIGENKAKFLLEDSKATCTFGCPGCIFIKNHGQTGEGNQEQVKKGDNDVQNNSNPLFKDFVEEQTQAKAEPENMGPSQKREIVKVVMEDINCEPIPKGVKYHYGKVVNSVAHTTGMVGELLHFEMWEDDAVGAGHSDENRYNKVAEQFVVVGEKGVAEVRFVISRTFSKIATAHNAYEGKTHEYYIIVYANETPVMASGNINIYAPEYKEEKKKVIIDKIKGISPVGVQEPKQIIKAEAPKVIIPKVPRVPGTKRVPTPKPVVPKAGKPKKITHIFFTDDKNHKITQASYDGMMIRAHFGSTGLINQKVKMRLYDHEAMGENNFLDETPEFTIKESPCYVRFALNEKVKKRGANLYSDNVFVDIEIMETKAHIVSTQIKVDTNNSIFEIARNITKSKYEEVKVEKGGTCFCKQKENQFNWSSVLTCDQRKKVLQVCKNLWPASKANEKASELMSIIHLETDKTFRPSIDNGVGFSGLIQFSDASAKGLNTTRSKLKAMTFTEQMNYVEKYLSKNKAKLTTMTDLYLMVLKPNAVGQGTNPNYVLFDESIKVPDGDGSNTSQSQRLININQEPWVTKYGYASNPTYHLEKGEHDLRKKWVYTRQRFEQRRGFVDGKTIVKEVTEVLVNGHYNPGKAKIFIGNCENIKEEKVDGGKRAPWMDIAINVAKEMKGCKEGTEPMYSNAKKYLKYCDNNFEPTDGKKGPWCAAFMNWSINQTTNKSTKLPYEHANSAASLAPIDSSKYRKIDAPIYGCIVVYKQKDVYKGHTGFLYGKTVGGEYILIGGNQDDTIRFDSYGEYTSKSKTKKLYGFYIPKDYIVTDEDTLIESDTYSNAEELNTKYGIISNKGKGKTN